MRRRILRARNRPKLSATTHPLRSRKAAVSFPICLILIVELRLEDQIDHVNNYIGSLQFWRVMASDNLLLNAVG